MISWTALNIFSLIAGISAEFYSSLASLKAIIEAERNISERINFYVEKELKMSDNLRKFAQVKENKDNAIRDGEEMIKHPINAFLLIKEMTTDWKKVVKMMQSNSGDNFIRNVTRQWAIKRITYHFEEDLSDAAIGLLRLQDTYQMDTKDIADGKFLNFQIRSVALNAGDCFEIGRAAYNAHDYYHSIMWMQEARERLEKEAVPTADLEDILEYLAFSLYKKGNLKRALLLTDELYHMNPDHPRVRDNIRGYEGLLENNGVQRIDMRRDIPPMCNVRNENDFDEGAKLTYEASCRQEALADTTIQLRLYCYYKMDNPYLRLSPFKVEIVRQNPLVAIIYDILSDLETQIIQMLAVPKACLLKRSMSFNYLTGKFEPASFRVAMSTQLKSMEHETVKRIDRRLELATNLEIETAEDLRVHNYGTGGYFGPHLDCGLISVISIAKGDKCFEKLGTGNRIATALIYMTEPEIGGRTVFLTSRKISVPCIKNALLFWYDLMRNGEVDMRSRHAGCPVLTGIKWIMTKQFHERGQEWRRPCGLNRFNQELYVGDLGAPEPKHHPNIRS
uniref:procollagen-proline 4-dioxygenase n=1 Tax=Onchocerca volvulus TaxID=6282 RepID=A0A8R1TND4_ONCVO